jgi:PAS domain S-box-containing protein
MTTEHQNLLFSQALSIGSEFSIIVRQSGTIVYANRGLHSFFGGTAVGESKALESIFERGGVSKPDRERVMGSIYNNMSDRLVFPIPTTGGEPREIILTIEPLARPAGFILIRGREFRGERTGLQMLPEMLRSTSVDKLDHLLTTTPIAHYATDVVGRIEYVNDALERAFGYTPGEILENRFTLSTLLLQMNGKAVTQDYTIGDFTGEAVVHSKSGKPVSCLLFQSVIRDEKNKPVGATGSIITPEMVGE